MIFANNVDDFAKQTLLEIEKLNRKERTFGSIKIFDKYDLISKLYYKSWLACEIINEKLSTIQNIDQKSQLIYCVNGRIPLIYKKENL